MGRFGSVWFNEDFLVHKQSTLWHVNIVYSAVWLQDHTKLEAKKDLDWISKAPAEAYQQQRQLMKHLQSTVKGYSM